MSYIIRKAEEADVQSVFQFINRLEETIFDLPAFLKIFNNNICQPHYHYLVAVAETEHVIGFISCHTQDLLHHCGTVAEIQELFVEESSRGLGIGAGLVRALVKALRGTGCLLVEVTAQNKRVPTHLFYENMGFTCTHKKYVQQLV